MKICILTHTFPKYPDDTTAAFMHPLVLGLIAAGNRVTVLTPFHPDLRIKDFPYPIITYKYIWPDSWHILGYSQTLQYGTHLRLSAFFLAPLLLLFGTAALLRLVTKERFDIVASHWIIPNGIIASVVCTIRRIPFVVTLPGSDVYVAQKNALFSFLTRWAAGRAAFVCADSPVYLKELAATGARAKKQAVIPYPVDISTIQLGSNPTPLRKKLGLTASGNILVSVGRLVEKKGFQYAIEALPEIIKKFPNTQYVIVGDGDMRSSLGEKAKILGVQAHIHLVGNIKRSEISNYYALADVILVPSIRDHEGNIDDRPVALIEAMACGAAVVASRLPGNALTIEPGESGLLIPPKQPSAIADAVVRLLGSKQLRKRIGKEAQRKVIKKFSHTVISQKYHNLFKSVVRSLWIIR